MTWHVGVGGVHKAVTGLWVGVGGVWKQVTRADVGVGGAWKLGFSAITLNDTYTVSHITTTPNNAVARFELRTDGGIYRTQGVSTISLGNWTVPGDDTSQYEVVASLTSGSVDNGSFGTLNLGTSRLWDCLVSSGAGSQLAAFTLAIRRVGGSTLDSTSVTLEAESTP